MAVLGAGAWGTALALTALAAGRDTLLWVREDDVLAAIRAERKNRFLPGVTLPGELQVTGDLAEAAAGVASSDECRRSTSLGTEVPLTSRRAAVSQRAGSSHITHDHIRALGSAARTGAQRVSPARISPAARGGAPSPRASAAWRAWA